jgi:hypothetical protein
MAMAMYNGVVEVTVLAHGGVKMMMAMMTPGDDEWR